MAALLVWSTLAALAILLVVTPVSQLEWLFNLLAPLRSHIEPEKAVYSPIVYLALFTTVILLQRRYPVHEQPFFTTQLAQDAIWYGVRMAFRIFFLGAFVLLLKQIYDNYFWYLTIDSAVDWHPAVRAIVAILLMDFLRWVAHLTVHKVPVFWAFHSVHHSQRELNLFTGARSHPVEQMVYSLIRFIPLLMFQNAFPVILAWTIIETVYPKLYHANIRLNFGPFRYLFVTPQSHRIHHSIEPEHFDKNFGFMFSIWDRMFGTQYDGANEYPKTGIADQRFPNEAPGASPLTLFVNTGRQLIYPFVTLGRMARAKHRARHVPHPFRLESDD